MGSRIHQGYQLNIQGYQRGGGGRHYRVTTEPKYMILVIFSIVQFQWPQRHARYRVGKLIWSRICFDHRTSKLELFDSSSVGGDAAAGSPWYQNT